jgi:hypothetical protein
MFKEIEKPAACKMRSVIRFLNARNVKLVNIHRKLCEVCGEYATSDSVVRRWVKHFNEGREKMHDDTRSGRPSVGNEDLVRAVEEKRRFTISSLSLHFPQISRSILHEIVSDKLRGLHRRRHHSTIQDTKTGASAMVETMSKISVRYVHQMAI